MENKRMLEKIKDTVEDVVKSITKKQNITPAELEYLEKSVCLLEKLKAIEEDETEGGYSERGNSYNSGNSSHRMSNSYNKYEEPMIYDDASYRRGRSPSTGRYVSRDGGSSSRYYDGGSSSRRYYDGSSSRNSGYSGHSIQDRMVARLEEMYDEARTDHERQTVDDWINRLRD